MNVDLPPQDEKESEVDMSALSSLFHAGSNDQKVRNDVNKFEFLNKVNEHSRKTVKNIFKDTNKDFIGEVPRSKQKSPKRHQISTPAGSEKGSDVSRRSRQTPKIPSLSPKRSATPILTPKRRSPSPYRRSQSPKRTPSPRRRRSPSPRRRSPSPRRRSPSPRKKTPSPRRRSPSPVKVEDKNLLLQSYYLLQAQGIETKMKLDLTCEYDIIKSEVDRMRTELNSQKCIKFARKTLVAIVSGLEFLNHKYDPCNLKLDGWSEHIMSTLGDYDGCFLRLYDKYKDSAGNVSPEVELLLLLGGSATMFHITKSFVSQRIPKFTEVAKESPELASKIANIMAQKYDKEREKDDRKKDDSSDSDDDDLESVNTQNFENMSGNNRNYSIPTDMLSTPAFPALIQKMVHNPNPRPKFNPMGERKRMPTVEEEMPPPLKENSENVLVVS